MPKITVKQGEAKNITFTIKENNVVVDLSTATLTFNVKALKDDTSALITVADGAFDKTDAASGIVVMPLSATNLDQDDGVYVAELKIVFSESNIDKSSDIKFIIEKAVA